MCGFDKRRQSGHVCDKGAVNKARVVTVFSRLGMSGTLKPSHFFWGRRRRVMITRLCDVGRCTATAIPLWVLVEMRLEMLVDSYREDPQVHCAAKGDAVRDVGRF